MTDRMEIPMLEVVRLNTTPITEAVSTEAFSPLMKIRSNKLLKPFLFFFTTFLANN